MSTTANAPALNFTNPTIVVLASNLPGPDDLALAPDGSILISDVADGTIKRLMPDGSLNLLLSSLSEPEGMVFLPDGSLIIAEQGKNRLVRYDLATKTLSTFIRIVNTTDQAGIDGIILDSSNKPSYSLILPDSPNGRILRVNLEDRKISEVARGFVRPTGAFVEPDGSLLVVDEYGNALKRVFPNGSIEKLADLPTPDDVIEDSQGNIYVSTLGDGAIHIITPSSNSQPGQNMILVNGLSSPQGLIFDVQGNLVVSDPGHQRVVKVIIH